MKSVIYFAGVLSVILVLGVAITKNATAGDVEPKVTKVLLENDKVRVVESFRQPGVIEPMHTHDKPFLAYWFEPCKIKVSFPDGKTRMLDIPAGKVIYQDSVTHELEVIGDTVMHDLHIDFK